MKGGCESQKIKKPRSVALPVLGSSAPDGGSMAHSKTSIWRAGVLIALNLAMIAHYVQWQISGTTISPIEPSEAMYTLQNGAINAGFIFFTLAILATLIFGRFVCGWGCHILALQDLCAWMLKRVGLTPRPFRSRLLVFVPLIAALYMFVWPTFLRVLAKPPNEPIIPQFTNHLVTTEFWATFPPFWVAIPFLLICGFLTVYFLGSKGFCTYGCPYGGFFSLADKVSPGRIRVTDACNQCGHCTATCTSNVLVHAEVKEYGMVVDQGCMKCMDCVSVCPNDALYFGFGKPAVGVSAKIKKNYSLTWQEEMIAAAVFVVSYFAVWDVYQLVPMLMALGIAPITTFLVLRTIRLFQTDSQSFYKYSLKSAGKMRVAGWVFVGVAALWTGLNVHSGWIRYHERAGAIAFESLQLPDELALAQKDPAQWLNAADRNNIEQGRRHFQTALNGGFFVNVPALPKLAWLEFLSGNPERAVELLAQAAKLQDDQGRALSLYYQGAILNRKGSYDQALTSLGQALALRPDLVLAREEIGVALWQKGKREEAVTVWTDAVKSNPALPLANNLLAGAAASVGNQEVIAVYEKQADRSTPEDARFHWMLGLRLQNVGMNRLAEKHFQRAIQINPGFAVRSR
ncbi:MAG: tetratricopeptide repeat protein [Pyrinomonadaceae bacterium]|nr:tetratricopeptide repeat protein [Pyrinomonadaceae bacterium]